MKAPLKIERERTARLVAVAKRIRETLPDARAIDVTEFGQAIDAMESNAPISLSPEPDTPVGPNDFLCPHCGTVRPSYGWHFNIGDTGPFALQWLTCFCGECKNILSVAVPAFLPKQELVDQLKRQFAGKVGLA